MSLSNSSLVSIVLLFVLVTGLPAQEVTFTIVDALAVPTVEIGVEIEITTDGAVEDYRFDVCNDDLVSVEEVSRFMIGFPEYVEFEFHLVELFDEGFTVDAIVSKTSELEAFGTRLYEATYSIGDELGTSTLEFCGDLLEAEATVDGTVVTPIGEDGSIEIVEGDVEFVRGDTNGDGFVNHILDAYYILSWSFAGGDAPPCEDAADADNNGNLFGLLEALALFRDRWEDPTVEIPWPGSSACGFDPEAGDLGCETPPDCPASDNPILQDPNEEYELIVESVTAVAGSNTEIGVSLTNTGDGLGAWQFTICFDEDLLEIEEGNVVYGDDISELRPAFEILDSDDDRIHFVFILNPLFSDPLAPGDDLEMYSVFFDISDDADGTVLVEFCTEGDFDPSFLATDTMEGIVPTTVDGGFEITDSLPFLRGDVDGDGEVNGIVDALALLVWGFQNGIAPPCRDAADVDDSGGLVPILDTIYLLEYAFTNGEVPPDPGPTDCGIDPTTDSVECAEASTTCL